MLTIENLTVERGQNKVLCELSAILQKGSIHGIVGLNGSGKTTLLETLFGLLPMKEGKVIFDESRLTNNNIAYLEADPFFYPRITGKDYLNIFRIKNPKFDFEEWNKLFKLPLRNLIEHYSSGMKKKLAFLGLLSFEKPIMILDEPFNSLDLETVEIIKEVLIELKSKGLLVIITSHILESLISMCDEIHYLNGGRFEKHYSKNKFDIMESEIFELLRDKNKQIIKNLI